VTKRDGQNIAVLARIIKTRNQVAGQQKAAQNPFRRGPARLLEA
jgi:hypothetical protein